VTFVPRSATKISEGSPESLSIDELETTIDKKDIKTQDQVVVEEHLKTWILNSVEAQQELDLEALQESTNVEYARQGIPCSYRILG
jgi:hypothetical protein